MGFQRMGKYVLLFLLLVVFTVEGFSQDKSNTATCSKEIFLQKSLKDTKLSKAVTLYLSEKYDEAYVSIKSFQGELDEKYDPYVFFLEAEILYKTASYSKSLELYDKVSSMNATPIDLQFYALIYGGSIRFHAKQEYDSSIVYYQKAQQLLKDTSCQEQQIFVYEGLGNSYLFTSNYSESERYYNKLLNVYQQKRQPQNIARAYSNLANLFYEQMQDEKAKAYFLKAYEEVKSTTYIKVQQQILFNLYAVNEGLGKYKEALDYLSRSNVLKDSIWNRDKVWELAEKDKEISIAIKDKELTAQKEIAEKRKIRLQWGGAILVVIVLFLGTLFYSYKTKVKQNKIITAQKGELEKLNHTKNYLFSVISHDLRSPVKMLIKQQQSFLKKIKSQDTASLEETAGSTLTIAEGLNHLLNNVLHWSLEQNDQLIFEPKAQPLLPIITQVVFDFKLLVAEKNIDLTTHLDEEVFANVDRESIKVVLRNLLDNAIKYTPKDGIITISTFEKDDACYIKVQNSGVGISEEQLERINSLQELSIDKINRSKGIGLGLLLCTTLTKKNGGTFHVDGEPNKGTTVEMQFPAVKDVF